MLTIENLTFNYRGQSNLFAGLSLEETDGQIIGLLGKNGAGKTTLLQLITGLLTPKSGSVEVDGYVPVQRDPDFLQQVYYVPEEFYLPLLSMKDYIRAMAPNYPSFDKQKMAGLLDKFELHDGMVLNKISLGQKKKFRIAFALATGCRLIVLDEPTNGLDIPSKAIFRQVVAGSITEGQLVIISTHQVKDVEALLDKIMMVDHGRVVFTDKTLDITDKYAFRLVPTLTGEVVYSEPSPSGFKAILPANGVATEVDIELLFNAVTSGVTL